MIDKTTILVWHCDKPKGRCGYLFHGNPNKGLPPYHFGGIGNLMFGECIVYGLTRCGLMVCNPMREWNRKFPQFRVKPRRITIEMRPCAKGGSK